MRGSLRSIAIWRWPAAGGAPSAVLPRSFFRNAIAALSGPPMTSLPMRVSFDTSGVDIRQTMASHRSRRP